ncbi:hypothetical protein PHET_10347 [Paragonimus heterotremus]|uniref:Peptidase S1 domain-containing protein n=1 Tax=Paragonimus heterotremus TaxID=100268 RepID=A0A8J4WCL6_9TREM|nr:hypothetical protein PHET_10347 [Paragonimus heterotremus]
MNFVSSLLAICSSIEVNKRIINGTLAQDGAYPWIAHMKHVSEELINYCGATIISNQWLLTAAHCMWSDDGSDKLKLEYWHVQIGSMKIVKGAEHTPDELIIDDNRHSYYRINRSNAAKILHFHVDKIILHPSHKIGLLEYDIALMKIKGRIPYIWKKSTPISLPLNKQVKRWPLAGTNCTIVGWGCTRAGEGANDVASVAELEVLPNCSKFYNGVNDGHEFCAGYNNSGVGTCPGDGGNGLFCKHLGSMMVMGVMSGLYVEKPQTYPSIYVRVAAFIDWIQMEMKRN